MEDRKGLESAQMMPHVCYRERFGAGKATEEEHETQSPIIREVMRNKKRSRRLEKR